MKNFKQLLLIIFTSILLSLCANSYAGFVKVTPSPTNPVQVVKGRMVYLMFNIQNTSPTATLRNQKLSYTGGVSAATDSCGSTLLPSTNCNVEVAVTDNGSFALKDSDGMGITYPVAIQQVENDTELSALTVASTIEMQANGHASLQVTNNSSTPMGNVTVVAVNGGESKLTWSINPTSVNNCRYLAPSSVCTIDLNLGDVNPNDFSASVVIAGGNTKAATVSVVMPQEGLIQANAVTFNQPGEQNLIFTNNSLYRAKIKDIIPPQPNPVNGVTGIADFTAGGCDDIASGGTCSVTLTAAKSAYGQASYKVIYQIANFKEQSLNVLITVAKVNLAFTNNPINLYPNQPDQPTTITISSGFALLNPSISFDGTPINYAPDTCTTGAVNNCSIILDTTNFNEQGSIIKISAANANDPATADVKIINGLSAEDVQINPSNLKGTLTLNSNGNEATITSIVFEDNEGKISEAAEQPENKCKINTPFSGRCEIVWQAANDTINDHIAKIYYSTSAGQAIQPLVVKIHPNNKLKLFFDSQELGTIRLPANSANTRAVTIKYEADINNGHSAFPWLKPEFDFKVDSPLQQTIVPTNFLDYSNCEGNVMDRDCKITFNTSEITENLTGTLTVSGTNVVPAASVKIYVEKALVVNDLTINAPGTIDFPITNGGVLPVTITEIKLPTTAVTGVTKVNPNDCVQELDPKETCNVKLTVDSSAKGEDAIAIRYTQNNGIGLSLFPNLKVTKTAIKINNEQALNLLPGQSITVPIENTGKFDLTWNPAADIKIVGTQEVTIQQASEKPCSAPSLSIGDKCNIVLTASPTVTQDPSINLQISGPGINLDQVTKPISIYLPHLMILGQTTGGYTYVLFDNNGSWSAIKLANTFNPRFMAGGNNIYLAIGSNSHVYRSSNGVTWADQGMIEQIQTLSNALTYANGKFIVLGKDAQKEWVSASSVDGNKNWRISSFNITTGTLSDVVWGNDEYLAVGTEDSTKGSIYKANSADLSWNKDLPNNMPFTAVAYGKDRFIVVGKTNANIGQSLTKINSQAWQTTPAKIDEGFTPREIVYGGGTDKLFVVIGNLTNGAGAIYTSADGAAWAAATPQPEGINFGINSIVWDGSQFIAVAKQGSKGVILTSANGKVWTIVDPTSLSQGVEFNKLIVAENVSDDIENNPAFAAQYKQQVKKRRHFWDFLKIK